MYNHSKPVHSLAPSTLAHYLAAKFSKLTPMFLYRLCCFAVCASISGFIAFMALVYAQNNLWASIPAWGWLLWERVINRYAFALYLGFCGTYRDFAG